MHLDRDTVVNSSGDLTAISLERGTGRVVLTVGAASQAHDVGVPLLGPRLSPFGEWAAIGADDGIVRVYDDEGQHVGGGWPSTGDGGILWDDEDRTLHVQRPGVPPPSIVDRCGDIGEGWTRESHYPAPYASTGLHRVEHGEAISETDPRRQAVQNHFGVTLYNCSWQDTPEGRYTVGLADGDVGGTSGGVVCLSAPHLAGLWMLAFNTQQTPRIAVKDDDQSWEVWIAVSGEGSPEPWAVVPAMVPFKAPPAPALPVLTVPQFAQPVVTGYLGGEDDAPGVLHGTGSLGPLLEGFRQSSGLPWFTPAEEPRLRVIFVSPHDSHAPDVEWREALAAQDRTGATIGPYSDRATYDQHDRLMALRAESRPAMPILCAFPSVPTSEIEHQVSMMLLGGIERVAVLGRTTADLASPRETLLRLQWLANLAAAYPGMVHLLFFGWKRGELPEARAYVKALTDSQPAIDLDAVLGPRIPRKPNRPPVKPKRPKPPQPDKPNHFGGWKKG